MCFTQPSFSTFCDGLQVRFLERSLIGLITWLRMCYSVAVMLLLALNCLVRRTLRLIMILVLEIETSNDRLQRPAARNLPPKRGYDRRRGANITKRWYMTCGRRIRTQPSTTRVARSTTNKSQGRLRTTSSKPPFLCGIRTTNIPTTVIEPRDDCSLTISTFPFADSFRESETFQRWLDRVPTEEEGNVYAKSLRYRLSKWPAYEEFKWPKNPPEKVYFLEGPSTFEHEPDFIIDYVDKDGNVRDPHHNRLEPTFD